MDNHLITVGWCKRSMSGVRVRSRLRCEVVDGHRGYADDSQPSWYTGPSRPYDDPARPATPYESGVHERPSGAFRLPEQRATETAYQPPPYLTAGTALPPVAAPLLPPETTGSQIRVPVRGPEYPAVRPTAGGPPPAPEDDKTEQVYVEQRHQEQPGPSASVRRPKRPLAALMVPVATAILLVPALVLLFTATFLDDATASGVIPAVLLTLGLLLAGLGMFALTEETPVTRADWLRPPVVHLPVGLLLLITAAVAVA